MYNIATINKISPVGLSVLNDKYTVTEDTAGASGIIVRSQDLHDMEFGRELLAIARAGSGVNNIPLERCSDSGIVVFSAPGANANAVKELVLATMIMAARNIPDALDWTSHLEGDVTDAVEAGKGNFAGSEIKGKTLGVLGLGSIGQVVSNAAYDLGMNVIGFDPFITLKAALNLNPGVKVARDVQSMLSECDFLSIHIPVNDKTMRSIDKSFFDLMKDGTIMINFSRDKLINEADLMDALDAGKIRKYVTDFPTEALYKRKDVISVPHLGASTSESEINCGAMAARELMDYIECGNITNSVNFPDVDLGPLHDCNRVAIMTKGEPNPVKLAAAMFADKNIRAIAGGTKGQYGYALIATNDMILNVPKVEGVIKVRIIQDL